MKLYLSNLIPRLREFSLTLDTIETFVDIPWVIIDENLNQQKYIFKRNGALIMSLNGQVTLGRWEFLSTARSLLIDRIKDKIMLNQNFIDPAVMVLKMDGLNDESLVLANEILLPDLNVIEYLKQLYYRKNRIVLKTLKGGITLEIYNYDVELFNWYNRRVTIEDEPISDGKYELEETETIFDVRSSKIIGAYLNRHYNTNNGEIVIEESLRPNTQDFYRSIGDLVFQNNAPALDGKYRIGFWSRITVKNGKIL